MYGTASIMPQYYLCKACGSGSYSSHYADILCYLNVPVPIFTNTGTTIKKKSVSPNLFYKLEKVVN